jgi:hypothetical protein
MTSSNNDIRQALGFFASFAFFPNKNEYKSANIS